MEGVVVRRAVPPDNSCLFHAVGYVMHHDRTKNAEIREIIVAEVASDPIKFSEVFLEMPNTEYCSWIANPRMWGGAIELSILSEHYGRQIAAYDIKTGKRYLYGEESNYEERVLLLYDGVHYDALAMSPTEGAPEEFDQTIFPVKDGSIGSVERLALNFVKGLQKKL